MVMPSCVRDFFRTNGSGQHNNRCRQAQRFLHGDKAVTSMEVHSWLCNLGIATRFRFEKDKEELGQEEVAAA